MSIEVDALVKHFRAHQRGACLRASLRSVVRREHVDVRAVAAASFGWRRVLRRYTGASA